MIGSCSRTVVASTTSQSLFGSVVVAGSSKSSGKAIANARRRQRAGGVVVGGGGGGQSVGASSRSLATAAQLAPIEEDYHPSASTSFLPLPLQSSSYPTPTQTPTQTRRSSKPQPPLTPTSTQSYLSQLLSLPPTKQFPPSLALRLLTHKSYRSTHLLSGSNIISHHSHTHDVENPEPQGGASHNGRFTFLGKRAFNSYWMMFLHSTALEKSTTLELGSGSGLGLESGVGVGVSATAGLRGLELSDDLATFMDNLNNSLGLGKDVGLRWGVGDVMRWSGSHLAVPEEDLRASGSYRIQGDTVHAILGGTMMQFGSPAAHRLFHTQLLPHLARRSKMIPLREAVEKVRVQMMRDVEIGGGGVVRP